MYWHAQALCDRARASRVSDRLMLYMRQRFASLRLLCVVDLCALLEALLRVSFIVSNILCHTCTAGTATLPRTLVAAQ